MAEIDVAVTKIDVTDPQKQNYYFWTKKYTTSQHISEVLEGTDLCLVRMSI